MSSRRKKLDYKILHTSGKRLEKALQSKKSPDIDPLRLDLERLNITDMSGIEKLEICERRISEELEDFIFMNEVKGLRDVDYIDIYRSEIVGFYRKYKGIHEKMIEVGEKEHQKLCPSYIKRVEEIKQRVRQIDMEKIKLKKNLEKIRLQGRVEEREERRRKEELMKERRGDVRKS